MPDIRLSGDEEAVEAPGSEADRPAAPIGQTRAFAEPRPRDAPGAARPAIRHGPAGHIALSAEALPDLDDPAFGQAFDRFGDARVVLLGQSTQGTSEFYRARAAITRWLVENRGFNIMALEADAPDGRGLDAQVRERRRPHGSPPRPAGWMWRNAEFDAFLGWLVAHNRERPPGAQVAIHGLDLYNLADATRAVVEHLHRADPDAAAMARARFGCVRPWAPEPPVQGRIAGHEAAVTAMLVDRLARQLRETSGGDDALVSPAVAARLLQEAESHYRAMYYGGAEAWNLRSAHMFETLRSLVEARGRDAKAVVWAHNAHVGDARATEMGAVRDAVSLGQLCRQAWADEVRLIGFGTHIGTVACAGETDGAMVVRPLPPAAAESQERLSHAAGLDRFLLDLRTHVHSATRRALSAPRPERFIGAGYDPETEPADHDAECRLPDQFDAWVWFDETTAVTPLPAPAT